MRTHAQKQQDDQERPTSPPWDCASGGLPSPDPEPNVNDTASRDASPARQVNEDEDPVDGIHHECDNEDTQGSVNRRNMNWLAWQDRMLAVELLDAHPFEAARGTGAWDKFAERLYQTSISTGSRTPIRHTGASCRTRFLRLMEKHVADQMRSMQKTGTNEEIDEHVKNMTELYELYTPRKSNLQQLSAKAQSKIRAEENAGAELRDASMKGLVEHEKLTDITKQIQGSTIREKQGQCKRKGTSKGSESDEDDSTENMNPSPKRRQKGRSGIRAVKNALEKQVAGDQEILARAQVEEAEWFTKTIQGQERIIESNNELKDTMERGFGGLTAGLNNLAAALNSGHATSGRSDDSDGTRDLNRVMMAALVKKL
ncbi:hypothetical protein PM082_010898 [Marasmius tenuissimus]|nr:hypothetical protein PM082_010898 [Marasmius tenuissimus]